MPSVVYVAGYGRSGSTVLDILLGNHPSIFGAGELAFMLLEWTRGGTCSCGQTYADCDLWHNVIDRVYSALPDLPIERMRQVTRRVQSSFAWPWSLSGRSVGDREEYRRLWQTVLAAIGEESGRSIIVDSSKSSGVATGRARALQQLCKVDVKVIHLVRDHRAILWSALRGSNKSLEVGQNTRLPGDVHRALLGWGQANLSVHLATGLGKRLPVMRIRYEDLVREPVQVLHSLGGFLELDMEPILAKVRNREHLDAGHGVGGNRLRRKGPMQLAADEEWKTALPAYPRALAALSWPLAGRYGYAVSPSLRQFAPNRPVGGGDRSTEPLHGQKAH